MGAPAVMMATKVAKSVLTCLGGLVVLSMVAVTALAGGAASGAGGDSGTPTEVAIANIPAEYLALYIAAAGACSGLPWGVLAAIGTVESSNGTSDAAGVRSAANGSGAEGPMQFLPATFAEYSVPVPAAEIATPDPPGDPPDAQSPYNPADAIFAAARLLCANGIATNPSSAVYSYNHSAAYVAQVLALAQSYESYGTGTGGSTGPSSPAQLVAVQEAETQLGLPYQWGGESPGVDFDCSGLTQWSMAQAGIAIPRVAQDQFDAGPQVASAADLVAGDLVFFGSGPTDVSHVGMYVGGGQMIDAPDTGAFVRIESIPSTFGARWGGGDLLVGATSPGGGS